MLNSLSSLFELTTIGIPEITIRLLAAAGLTMVIGLEREIQSKPAGLRTHMLVGLGAAAFYIVGYEVFMRDLSQAKQAQVDLIRIMEGLVGGIGFLGAGAIIQARGDVRGLTTAAGMWVSGAIGLICGAGFYSIALVLAILTFFVLFILGVIEKRLLGTKQKQENPTPFPKRQKEKQQRQIDPN